MQLRSAHSSNIGLPAIGANDDRVFIDESKKLFALLDGSGPTYGGHHESKGVDYALQVFLEAFTESAEEEPISRLCAAFVAANDGLLEQGGPLPGGLSHYTAALTVAWFLNGEVFIGHVGESCVFHWRRGELKQIVPPDTCERMLLEQGEDPELAALHRSAPSKRLGFERTEPSVSTHEVGVSSPSLRSMITRQRSRRW